ncbi:transcriptional regulator [Natrinema thermotolerans]|nr:transcriptional regulator [Natrinema thermotolerans]
MTGTDLQIIDALGRGLTLSPTIISDNTDKSREAISRRLSTLQAAGYVEKTGRGRYEITEKGMEFLEGRVLPNDDDWAINPDDDRANEENGE